ncbi:Spo0E like sporulation regulatory protein [compost metagenome]
METCDFLKSKIEQARQQLYDIEIECGSLLHPEVIQQSVVLDELINQYNRERVGMKRTPQAVLA